MSEDEHGIRCPGAGCAHGIRWHHDERGCGYHGFAPKSRCRCSLTLDEAVLRTLDAAVEAALAPIEREMEEQVDEWGTPWPWVPVIYKALAAARDAAKGVGR